MTDAPRKTGRAARATDATSVSRRKALEDWQREISDAAVKEILRYRDLRGISNDEFRARLAAIGWDLTRDSLASILSSKRKSMPLSDLLLFAQALNVPPLVLIFPVWTNDGSRLWPYDEDIEIAYRQAQWFAGHEPDIGARLA